MADDFERNQAKVEGKDGCLGTALWLGGFLLLLVFVLFLYCATHRIL